MGKINSNKPAARKVSIFCLTYNQNDYIRQCLDSLLMQKTDFEYEILINDDASDDGTADILKEYRKKYPEKIRLNLQTENQYSMGVRNMIPRFLLPKARGEYLAMCEGDDYWTAPDKLQIQVDFLEKHPDYSMCFHPVRVVFENGEQQDAIFPESSKKNDFTTEKLITANFIQTNSVMYRKQNYINLAIDIMPGDWYLHLFHAQFGKIGFINKVMSVYRRHEGGIWWKDENNKTEFWGINALKHLNFYIEVLKLVDGDDNHVKAATWSLNRFIDMVVDDCANDHNNNVVESMMSSYPNYIKAYMYALLQDNKEQRSRIIEMHNELSDKLSDKVETQRRLDQVESELSAIKGSKGWRILDRVYTVKNKLTSKK